MDIDTNKLGARSGSDLQTVSPGPRARSNTVSSEDRLTASVTSAIWIPGRKLVDSRGAGRPGSASINADRVCHFLHQHAVAARHRLDPRPADDARMWSGVRLSGKVLYFL